MQLPILLISKSTKEIKQYMRELFISNKFPPTLVHEFGLTEGGVKMETVRDIKKLLKRAGERLLIVIYNFDTARSEAQNALLKTLEEKGARAQFVLIGSDESAVLPTVVSRCILVKLKGRDEKSKTYFDLQKPLGFHLSSTDKIIREQAINFADILLSQIQDTIEAGERTNIHMISSDIIREIMTTRNLIEKNNLNPQMGIDHIFNIIYKHKQYRDR